MSEAQENSPLISRRSLLHHAVIALPILAVGSCTGVTLGERENQYQQLVNLRSGDQTPIIQAEEAKLEQEIKTKDVSLVLGWTGVFLGTFCTAFGYAMYRIYKAGGLSVPYG